MKQSVAAGEERRPTVGIEDVALHQFQAFLVAQRCRMGDDMVRFGGIVEVANRTLHLVAVLEEVADNVIANVTVHAGDEDALSCLSGHGAGETGVSYEPSSATLLTHS